MVLTPGACACTSVGEPTCLILPFSMSTAAGESTCPVRGSSIRPALTRVWTVGVWATTSPMENKTKNNAARTVHTLGMRLNPPYHYVLPVTLLTSTTCHVYSTTIDVGKGKRSQGKIHCGVGARPWARPRGVRKERTAWCVVIARRLPLN